MRCPTKLFLILCLCLVSLSNAASTVQWYVDPDAGGAGDGTSWEDAYNSQSAFEAAEGKDLTVSDEVFIVNCRSSSGGDDTTTYRHNGFTTDATRYVEYTGDSANGGDFPTDGKWDETKYLCHNNDSAAQFIENRDDFVRINKIQFKVTSTGAARRVAIEHNTINASNDLRISNCIVKGVCSNQDVVYGIWANDPDIILRIWNTVVYDIDVANATYKGIYIDEVAAAEINHCTVYNIGGVGIQRDAGTVDVSSCIVGNCGDDFSGTFNSIDSCCDDDDEGTNNQDPLNGNWTDELTDPANGDFTLKTASSNSVGNGADDPFGDGFGDPDIAGTSRTSTWDIGAFEWVTAAVGGQVIFINVN